MPKPEGLSPGQILARRMITGHLREVYRAHDGTLFLTMPGDNEPVSQVALDDAIRRGLIVPKYPDDLSIEFWRRA